MEMPMTEVESPNDLAHDARFDILKFILSFMVIAIHVPLFPEVLFPWLRMAVPLFFIITGYFLFRKLKGEKESKNRSKIVKKFAERNLKLYFFWFICLLPLILHIRKDLLFADTLGKTVLSFAKVILFGSTFTGSWYIMSSILGMLIIFFLLDRVPNRYLFCFCTALYGFLALTSSYPQILEKSSVIFAFLTKYQAWIGVPTLTFPVAIVWLVCGKCFAEGFFSFRRKSYVILCLVSAALLYGEWRLVQTLNGTYSNDIYLFLLPFCIGLFGWINSGKPVYSSVAIHLKRCSTVIYAMHGAANRIGKTFFVKVLSIDSALLCFVTSSVVCVLAYIMIVWILRQRKNEITKLLRYAY